MTAYWVLRNTNSFSLTFGFCWERFGENVPGDKIPQGPACQGKFQVMRQNRGADAGVWTWETSAHLCLTDLCAG